MKYIYLRNKYIMKICTKFEPLPNLRAQINKQTVPNKQGLTLSTTRFPGECRLLPRECKLFVWHSRSGMTFYSCHGNANYLHAFPIGNDVF